MPETHPRRNSLRRCCLVLVVAALAVAGCGSKNKTASQTTASSPTGAASSNTTTTSTTAAAADCNKLGINPTGMREGTCTHAGITYVIVDENHTLKLHSLTARLNGIHATSSLSAGKQATAQGKFVVLPITLTNRLGLAQSFDRSGTQQAGLVLEGTVYKEDTGVEQGSDPSSCLNHTTPLPSGK